jgi:hypothetical protein
VGATGADDVLMFKQKGQVDMRTCPGGTLAGRSDVRLGLAEPHYAVAGLPLAALLEQIDALEALEDVAFDDEAAAGFQAVVLGHGKGWI